MKSTIVLGIGATLLASCSGNRQKADEKVTQQQKKPNVIFLIADDIGYGDLSCNGSKTIHTPNVERLAAQGVRFTDAHAVAATSTPSRYSLFTGHYAWRRNDTGIAAGNAGMVIRPEQPTVADMFRECGYTTGNPKRCEHHERQYGKHQNLLLVAQFLYHNWRKFPTTETSSNHKTDFSNQPVHHQ